MIHRIELENIKISKVNLFLNVSKIKLADYLIFVTFFGISKIDA